MESLPSPQHRTAPGAQSALNGEDVTEAIRAPEISKWLRVVSCHPAPSLRHWWSNRRGRGEVANVVMEGRRYRTVVFPTPRKIFLDADHTERVSRDPRATGRTSRRARRTNSPIAIAVTAAGRIPLCRLRTHLSAIPLECPWSRWRMRILEESWRAPISNGKTQQESES